MLCQFGVSRDRGGGTVGSKRNMWRGEKWVFKTLTLYSSHKHRKWPVFTEEARVGYGKIKKIYTFKQKAMHRLSEKPGLSNPTGKKYLYIVVWTQLKHSKLKLNLRLTP